jgi:DNA-binding transcriptional LysR family regulator
MALIRFTFRQLEAAAAVADSLSFREAGKQLNISPSAVSQLVIEFEAVTGVRLFERSTRTVALTDNGSTYLPSILSVLSQAKAAARHADALSSQMTGQVRIAAPSALAFCLLPSLIAAYRQLEPKVIVHTVDTPVFRLNEAVRNGLADCAIGPVYKTAETVAHEPLFDSPWMLWYAPDSPLAAAEDLDWDHIGDMPLVIACPPDEFEFARLCLGNTQPALTSVRIVDNLSTALGLAKAGEIATIGPAYVDEMARAMGLAGRVLRPAMPCRIEMYRPSKHPMPKVCAGFYDFIRHNISRAC